MTKLIIHIEPEAKKNGIDIYRPWEDIPIPESTGDKNVVLINKKEVDQINIYAWGKKYSKKRLAYTDLKNPELYCAVHFNIYNASMEDNRGDVRIIVKKSDLHTFLGEIDYSKPLLGGSQ